MVLIKRKLYSFWFRLRVYSMRLIIQKPDVVLSFHTSLGDDLLCTIVAEQLYKKGFKNIWMLTTNPELFLYNPFISKTIKKNKNNKISPLFHKYFKSINATIINPWYSYYDQLNDRDVMTGKHIINVMCERAKVPVPNVIKPSFFLTFIEKVKGRLFENQICIQSSGRGAMHYMNNKEWYVQRFEQVAKVLSKKYKVIQVGAKNDPLLPNVFDMRGKTSIRETAALLYHSRFFVGQVGFLMHLSRAVDCKAVIVYGGREHPDQTGYDCNLNLYSEVICSPCWYWNFCENDKLCMKQIKAEDVIEATEKIVLCMENV